MKIVSGKLVTVDWNPPLDGSFDSFKIVVEPLSPQDDAGGRTIVIRLEDATPVQIRDLTPGAPYQVRLHTVNRGKESRQFLHQDFTTIPLQLSPPIIWFRNETTLMVKLQNPSEAIFDHYRVAITPEDADQSQVIIERSENSKGLVSFHGLIPGNTYNITVQTVSAEKVGEPSSAVFTTVPLTPQEPSNIPEVQSSYRHTPMSHISPHTAPVFTNGGPPSDLTFQDGRDAEIQCEASGSPYPTAEWFYTPSNDRDNRRRLDLSSAKYGVNAHGALSITQLEKSDEGDYTCVRSNNVGRIDGTSKLNVIVRTVIDQPPVDSKVILSSTAELQCRVRHDPSVKAQIYWTFNKRNLTTSSRIKVSTDGTLRIEQVSLLFCAIVFTIFEQF